jgi:hypothetical protein
VAVRGDEVDGGEDELELLPREVVGEAHPRPSRLHAMVALVEETDSKLSTHVKLKIILRV